MISKNNPEYVWKFESCFKSLLLLLWFRTIQSAMYTPASIPANVCMGGLALTPFPLKTHHLIADMCVLCNCWCVCCLVSVPTQAGVIDDVWLFYKWYSHPSSAFVAHNLDVAWLNMLFYFACMHTHKHTHTSTGLLNSHISNR